MKEGTNFLSTVLHRICKRMGRSYSGTRREILVFLGMRQEVELHDAHRNKIAVDVQCAFRSFFASKFTEAALTIPSCSI